jgi:hypothetical protein
MKRLVRSSFLCVLVLGVCAAVPAEAQTRTVKYGADFLAAGVGARALGMGGAYVALANDVSAGYWNPAGLGRTMYPEVAYMHAERFAGIVSADYGSGSFPLTHNSTIGISFFRSAVDDIPVTLNAFNPETGLPYPDPEQYISRFSAADYAFFLTYARQLLPNLYLGASGKVVRRGMGDFASAWGYSVDIGAQYRVGRVLLGVNLQDAFGMWQAWSVNPEKFNQIDRFEPDPNDPRPPFEQVFGQQLPTGGTELTLPVARLGAGYVLPITDAIGATLGFDVDVAFDNQRAFAINTGSLSYHPRIGTELTYRNVVALRAGISNVTTSERYGTQFTPTVGAGLNIQQVSIDYTFGDFAGLQNDLGFSHRISLRLSLEQDRLRRAPAPGTVVD